MSCAWGTFLMSWAIFVMTWAVFVMSLVSWATFSVTGNLIRLLNYLENFLQKFFDHTDDIVISVFDQKVV